MCALLQVMAIGVWTIAGVAVLVVAAAVVAMVLYDKADDRNLRAAFTNLGFTRLSTGRFGGSYRKFQVVIGSATAASQSSGIGPLPDVGYSVEVLLYDPATGGTLTSDQLTQLGGDKGLLPSYCRLVGSTMHFERLKLTRGREAMSATQTLDAAVATARDALLELTGVDVWVDDPRSLAKNSSSPDRPSWEQPA